ncbi:hypothetical protein SIID45300_02793 [Candidatus Magnetaquicoccaceae bacterium FCR-1]|uniref:Uncharacterized protein n=1 Tax=Candidatus Magnetaquiglobus chichijimensis TaxID=3141448 RepID=A0ABQ0CC48_9PROT
MTASAHRVGRGAIRTIRERDGVSLERVTPRHPARNHFLVVAPEPALSYLREMAVALEIDDKITFAFVSGLEMVASVCLEWHKRAGPFQRAHVVWEWDGGDVARMDSEWCALEEAVWERIALRPRPIVCRPSFLLWILWHFEDVDPDCCQAEVVRKRVESVLKKTVGVHVSGLHARTVGHLGEAVGRARRMSRLRQGGEMDRLWPTEAGTDLHELVLSWYRLARREV